MKSPTNINNIDTFADLRRYVSKRTSLSSAQSFERLVLDSIYDINKGQFTFQTTHSYYTEPRLKTLAKEVGIIWMKMQEEEIDYNNEYIWNITEKLGRGIGKKVKELKWRKEEQWKDYLSSFQDPVGKQ